ncbi:MAG: glycosyltransferase family 2 protein [Eubacteriales bacterium]|nr:glycosyltransferase family 2 protein [Eubacteriales bacterium]
MTTQTKEAVDPIVDVIIPTCYPDRRFLETLARLHRQSVRPRRIRVINTEREGFESLLREAGLSGEAFESNYPLAEIHHIRREEFDHGATRNAGALRCAGADFLLFMTQDALPEDRELVRNLLKPMERDPAGAVSYARQLPREGASAAERFTRLYNYPKQSSVKSQADYDRLGIKTYFCSNVCALYRKRTFDELGGFIRRTIFNEDMIYAGRALQDGWRIYYEAEARVVHSHHYSARQQFHRNFDLGVSQADHPEIFAASSSESEGMKYVRTVIRYLRDQKAGREIPGFVAGCAARLLGYRLGKRYRTLPRAWVLRFTMNRNYWNGIGEGTEQSK